MSELAGMGRARRERKNAKYFVQILRADSL
jgi:hypothetical protein